MLKDIVVFWELFFKGYVKMFRYMWGRMWCEHDRAPAHNEKDVPSAELHISYCNYEAPTVLSL
jgi:hypothetical protein